MATTRRPRSGPQRSTGLAQRSAPPFDPLQLSADEQVTEPHVLLLGQPGTGKSAWAKCIVARLLRSGAGGPRHVGIVDPKGEYGALAEAVGLGHVRLYPGGPHRLNPLDAGPSACVGWAVTADRRHAILAGLCTASLGRALSTAEDRALAAVVPGLAPPGQRQPVLFDVVRLLAEPTADMIGWAASEAAADECFEWGSVVAPGELVGAARHLGHALGRLLDRELHGCFDAATTVGIDGDGPGVVVDLSAFHTRRSALPLAVMASMAWIESAQALATAEAAKATDEATSGVFNGAPGQFSRRYNVIDEAWAVLAHEHASSYVEAWLDRAAVDGAANIVIAHRLHDLRWGPDDAEALSKRARAFVGAFGTRLVFRQSLDDAELARAALDLRKDEAAAITYLGLGQALWNVRLGAASVVGVPVQGEIGPDEWAFCDGPHTLSV